MSISKTLNSLIIMVSSLLILSACGGEDSGTASAPASAPAAAAPAASSSDSGDGGIFESLNIEKAEGVVYQDEIYANWPYN
jgi:hypothetical protein